MNEKISIIVPVYNAETTLCRCVDALIAQTYSDIEIILVNDGSKDRSSELCRAYALSDSRIQVIEKPNGGVSSARNAGLDRASGDFVMFCDSDDWAEANWCEELVSHYERGSLVMCGLYIEGEQPFLPYENCASGGIECFERQDFYRLRLSFITSLWNKLFERDIIEENHLRFDPSLSNGEDYLFVIQYLTRISGKIVYLPSCVFHYTWPDENHLSGRVEDGYFEGCGILFHAIERELPAFGTDSSVCITYLQRETFEKYESGMAAVLRDGSHTLPEKVKKLNSVMESPTYQKCVREGKRSSHRLVRFLWSRKRSYGIVILHSVFGRTEPESR